MSFFNNNKKSKNQQLPPDFFTCSASGKSNEVYSPAVAYAQPSAPPLPNNGKGGTTAYPTATVVPVEVYRSGSSGRIVEPFSIASRTGDDEATPLTGIPLDDDSRHNGSGPNRYNPTTVRGHPDVNGRNVQRAIDQGLYVSNSDGHQLSSEEQVAARYSSRSGSNISSQLDRKVYSSNSDFVDSFEIRNVSEYPGYDITQLTGYRYDATKDIIKKGSGSHSEPGSSRLGGTNDNGNSGNGRGGTDSGYEIKDYKSIYEDPLNTVGKEYKLNEYKSIYD
jgi:hypothetical protein